MTEEEVKKNLCYYDRRNPNHLYDEAEEDCSCVNCFHGRTKMAEYILELTARSSHD